MEYFPKKNKARKTKQWTHCFVFAPLSQLAEVNLQRLPTFFFFYPFFCYWKHAQTSDLILKAGEKCCREELAKMEAQRWGKLAR